MILVVVRSLFRFCMLSDQGQIQEFQRLFFTLNIRKTNLKENFAYFIFTQFLFLCVWANTALIEIKSSSLVFLCQFLFVSLISSQH